MKRKSSKNKNLKFLEKLGTIKIIYIVLVACIITLLIGAIVYKFLSAAPTTTAPTTAAPTTTAPTTAAPTTAAPTTTAPTTAAPTTAAPTTAAPTTAAPTTAAPTTAAPTTAAPTTAAPTTAAPTTAAPTTAAPTTTAPNYSPQFPNVDYYTSLAHDPRTNFSLNPTYFTSISGSLWRCDTTLSQPYQVNTGVTYKWIKVCYNWNNSDPYIMAISSDNYLASYGLNTQTWSNTRLGNTGYLTDICSGITNNNIICCGNYIARRIDNIWSYLYINIPVLDKIVCSGDFTLIIGYKRYGKVYTSFDNGSTWNVSFDMNNNWSSLTISNDGTKIAISSYNGYIYTSIDKGITWKECTSLGKRLWQGVKYSGDGSSLLAIPVSGISNSLGYIYRTTDNGNIATTLNVSYFSSDFFTNVTCNNTGNIIVLYTCDQNYGKKLIISGNYGSSFSNRVSWP